MREVAIQLANLARTKGAIVVAHGSHAWDRAGEYLHRGVDYILGGEGEDTLAALCSMLVSNKEPDAIAGWLRLNPSGHRATNNLHPPANPRWINLPMPAREL